MDCLSHVRASPLLLILLLLPCGGLVLVGDELCSASMNMCPGSLAAENWGLLRVRTASYLGQLFNRTQ